MASQIRFEPPGVDGLVASGTTIAAAAERLGVAIELRCGGKGECTTCAVRAVEEPFSLSPLTDAERRILSEADVAGGIRLGCQAKTGDADCTIHVLDVAERPGPGVARQFALLGKLCQISGLQLHRFAAAAG